MWLAQTFLGAFFGPKRGPKWTLLGYQKSLVYCFPPARPAKMPLSVDPSVVDNRNSLGQGDSLCPARCPKTQGWCPRHFLQLHASSSFQRQVWFISGEACIGPNRQGVRAFLRHFATRELMSVFFRWPDGSSCWLTMIHLRSPWQINIHILLTRTAFVRAYCQRCSFCTFILPACIYASSYSQSLQVYFHRSLSCSGS